MSSLLRMVKSVLPVPIKGRILKLRERLSASPEFGWTLKSGLKIKVANKSDWVIYNDIFVDGEYDPPILEALNSRAVDHELRVLDIGANVGFFTLRFIDLARHSAGGAPPFAVTLVEGSPSVAKDLRERLFGENGLSPCVNITHGLVGQRTGSGKIAKYDFHAMNTIVSGEEVSGDDVGFVDVETLLPPGEPVDLLKCDIEGAELMFLENYLSFLPRVRAAVFELHHKKCDTAKCMGLLRAGLHRPENAPRDRGLFRVPLPEALASSSHSAWLDTAGGLSADPAPNRQ